MSDLNVVYVCTSHQCTKDHSPDGGGGQLCRPDEVIKYLLPQLFHCCQNETSDLRKQGLGDRKGGLEPSLVFLWFSVYSNIRLKPGH